MLIIAKALLTKYADELAARGARASRPQALGAISKYTWPGNIRQLENRIKKALVLCDKTLLGAEDLELGQPRPRRHILPLEKAKEEFQRKYVLEVLERNNGNRTQTARDLGVDPRTIFRYLERESRTRCRAGVGRRLARHARGSLRSQACSKRSGGMSGLGVDGVTTSQSWYAARVTPMWKRWRDSSSRP